MDARRHMTGPARLMSVTLSAGATLVAPLAVLGFSLPHHASVGTFVNVPSVAGGTGSQDRVGIAVAPTTPTVNEFRLRELERRRGAGTAEAAPRAARSDGPGDASAPSDDRLVVTSEPRPVTGYGVVGATWDGARPGKLLFTVRTRTDQGQWSAWQTLHGGDCPCEICTRARMAVAAGHGPNVGSPEFAQSRQGTDAMAVGDVDQVQLRVVSPDGRLPEDLELSVVDPEPTVTAAESSPRVADAAAPEAAAGNGLELAAATTTGRAPRPSIFTRADWGANEKLRSGSPSYGTVKAGFVHHTVNANNYTRAQVPSIIRGIYAYHTQSRGWSDIGYNFLVDRFGRIWEGRYGGMGRPVIGAHTLGYNHLSFAMSAIGNFDVAEPPAEVARAYARLFAWKLDRHGVPAKSTPTLDGKRFNAISGHRDAGSTACPGRYLYAQLPSIRNKAAAIQAAADDGTVQPSPSPSPSPTPSPTPPPEPGPEVARDLHDDGRADLLVRDRETGRIQVLPGEARPGFVNRKPMDVPTGKVDLIAGVGDLTGDGTPDLLTRIRETGVTQVRPGRPGDRLFGSPLEESLTSKFEGANLVTGVGDLTGTRWPDLVVRDKASGRYWVHPGKLGGRFGAGTRLPIRPADVQTLTGAGDLTGDGHPDLLATTPDGRLLVYRGTDTGTVRAATQVATGWEDRDLTVAGADLTGDGVADLLARDRRTTKTFIYALKPGGTPGPRFGGWTTWSDLKRLTVTGDPGTGVARLVGRSRAGELVVLDSKGTEFFGEPVDTGRRAAGGNFAQVAGDWDGDGELDVITRAADSGNVVLNRGTGDGLLDEQTRLWAEWTDKTDLVVTGDLTGDEVPDMVARDTDDAIYVYPGDGEGGRQPRQLARAGLFDTDLVTAAGFWNSDKIRDLVVRNARNDRLYLLPGKADGTLGTPVVLTDSFAAYDRILGIGDHDRDGLPDLVATTPSGELWLFPGNGDEGLRKRTYLGAGMKRFDLLG